MKKIYKIGKGRILAVLALAGVLASNGCGTRSEQTTQELPYFAVRNIETVLAMDHRDRPKHIEDGVTCTPIVRFDTPIPQLEGVKAQDRNETYIFRSGTYDGRLTEIRNAEGKAYLRVGMLPDEFHSFEDRAGKVADRAYKQFIADLH